MIKIKIMMEIVNIILVILFLEILKNFGLVVKKKFGIGMILLNCLHVKKENMFLK
jgi:hypothetical protein